MTRFIIVRHGQSEANKAEVFVGHKDAELSEMGFRQAELVADELVHENVKIDKIYASDLKRAFHTVSPYAERVGKTVIKDRFLREIYAGKWEGHRFDELPLLFPKSYDVWKTDIGRCTCDGGESVAELYKRINAEIDRIAVTNSDKTILIGTHATSIRCIIARAKNVGLEGMQKLGWVGNASINEFLWKDGEISAVRINDINHLGALHTEFVKGSV